MSEWSHIRCVFADPGSVPHNALPLSSATDEERLNMCVKCNQFKPPRAHHCSECGRCIVKMDHHCPYFLYSLRLKSSWVNNCVGVANIKFFVLFLVYTFLYCSVGTTLGVFFFIHRITIEFEESFRMIGNGVVVIFGGFFTIFTCTMFCDTFSVIQSGTTCM